MKKVQCVFCEGVGYELYVWTCEVCKGEGEFELHKDISLSGIEKKSWESDF